MPAMGEVPERKYEDNTVLLIWRYSMGNRMDRYITWYGHKVANAPFNPKFMKDFQKREPLDFGKTVLFCGFASTICILIRMWVKVFFAKEEEKMVPLKDIKIDFELPDFSKVKAKYGEGGTAYTDTESRFNRVFGQGGLLDQRFGNVGEVTPEMHRERAKEAAREADLNARVTHVKHNGVTSRDGTARWNSTYNCWYDIDTGKAIGTARRATLPVLFWDPNRNIFGIERIIPPHKH